MELSCRFEIDAHTTTQGCRYVDQRVEREPGDSTTEQIVDPWLRHATMDCRFGLCPVALFWKGRNLLHQFGSRSQIRSLFRGISDGVPNARVRLCFVHMLSPRNCVYRLFRGFDALRT